MHLISCHVENFGAISHADYNFSSGITEFFEKNGAGKTTLASFLKAMFYGLPKATARTKEFNDRIHFYPFHGGKFGGNLSFEMGGKTYRIERFFDKNSEKKDTCTVYCNESLVKEGDPFFSEEPGEVVFGIDKDSFERTVFVTSAEFESGSTARINAKLNCFIDGTDESADFGKAIAALEDRIKDFKASRGSNDLFTRQRNAIAALDVEIANVSKVAEGLPEKYKIRNQFAEEIRFLEQKADAEQAALLLREKWDAYDRFMGDAESLGQELNALREAYPAGLPTEEELSSLREHASLLTKRESAAESCVFGEEKQSQLGKLASIFEGNLPETNELETIGAKLEEITKSKQELLTLQAQEKMLRENRAAQGIPERMPDAQPLERARTQLSQYKEKISQAESLRREEKESFSKPGIALLLLAILLLAGGGVLLFVSLLAGILTASAGAVLLVPGLALISLKKREVSQIRKTLETLQPEADVLEASVREFLLSYGYASENGIQDFTLLERDLAALEKFSVKQGEIKTQTEAGQQRLVHMEDSVKMFLLQYGITDTNLQSGFLQLQKNIETYKALQRESDLILEKKQSIAEEIAREESFCCMVFLRYDLQPDFRILPEQILQLDKARREMDRLEKDINSRRESAAAYKAENGLAERPEMRPEEETEDIRNLISQKRSELAKLDRQIEEDESRAELLSNLESKRDEEKALMETYQARYKVLCAAKVFLEQAEQNLKDRYVAPIKDKFCEYAEMLEAVFEEKIRMDKDFRVTFEGGGETRSEQHLSAGQRAMWILCFRLAMLDNLYEKGNPFIIMDDPFVNLDEAHMESVRKLLRQLSERGQQILYFCCHESRKIKN